jgi:class 3 adenylate cyclase
MAAPPVTSYAPVGEYAAAYQVLGEGADLLYVPAPQFPVDLLWDEPTVASHLRRMASFSRLILTDILGVGSSDSVPITDHPAMQSWVDGLIAVLDAAESTNAAIFTEAGMSLAVLMLAASHPQRVRSLVLWNPFARFSRAPDHPWGIPEPALSRYIERYAAARGSGTLVDAMAASWAGDPAKRRWWARSERLAMGPAYGRALLQFWMRTDVRPILESIQAPTLLLRRRNDREVPRGHALNLVERIPNVRLVEFDPGDHVWFAGDTGPVLDEIESFLTGERRFATSNRVLSTVLFTDIVGSTERAAHIGDDAWATTILAHNRVVERHIRAARGMVVKFTGDGVLATFDGTARAIECACAIGDAVDELGLSIRAGLHTGEVEIVDGDVHGIAVNIAARIMSLAGPREVLVSGVIPPLVLGSRQTFADRGDHELKGVPGLWRVFAVSQERG